MSDLSDIHNCPFCGGYLYRDSGYDLPDQCTSCSKSLALLKTPGVRVDLSDVSPALLAQASSAAQMTMAFVSANAIPIVSLLQGWWDKLNEAEKGHFAKALLMRALSIVGNGQLDDHLRTMLEDKPNWYGEEGIRRQLQKLDKDSDLTRAIAQRVAEQFNKNREGHELNDEIKKSVAEHIREVAQGHMRDQQEVIESAVRDRMPDIEKLTERVVREVTEDAAKEIRDRMKRNDDKDGGAYR